MGFRRSGPLDLERDPAVCHVAAKRVGDDEIREDIGRPKLKLMSSDRRGGKPHLHLCPVQTVANVDSVRPSQKLGLYRA